MISAIILAAGKGERMKTNIPKCAFPILKKPMINYIIDTLKKTKVDNRVIVVGHKKEVFLELLPNETFSVQEEQLGTADAVKSALDKIDSGITIVLPGDTPLISSTLINKLIDIQIKENNDMTLCTMMLDNPFGYGRIVRTNKKITQIVEEKDATAEEKKIKEVNTGIMVFDNEFLKKAIKKIKNDNAKGEYYLTDIVNFTKKISNYLLDNPDMLLGINDLYSLSVVEEKLEEDIKKKLLLSGVTIINKNTVTIGPDVEIEPGVTIYPNSFIMGKTKICKNSIIGPSSEIYNSIICENVLCRQSVVYDSTISKDATVGPFAHIRMNTIIGEKNRIGNFVEVKNSILGVNTKASHLSYLGDSEIGNNVNIGCGSITVNYDGKKKSKTIIGNNVFVGCNSNLIAPITIKDDSFIAAGSTITLDVEESDLAIARSKQINKKGYAKKYK